MINQLIFRQ